MLLDYMCIVYVGIRSIRRNIYKFCSILNFLLPVYVQTLIFKRPFLLMTFNKQANKRALTNDDLDF